MENILEWEGGGGGKKDRYVKLIKKILNQELFLHHIEGVHSYNKYSNFSNVCQMCLCWCQFSSQRFHTALQYFKNMSYMRM